MSVGKKEERKEGEGGARARLGTGGKEGGKANRRKQTCTLVDKAAESQ